MGSAGTRCQPVQSRAEMFHQRLRIWLAGLLDRLQLPALFDDPAPQHHRKLQAVVDRCSGKVRLVYQSARKQRLIGAPDLTPGCEQQDTRRQPVESVSRAQYAGADMSFE